MTEDDLYDVMTDDALDDDPHIARPALICLIRHGSMNGDYFQKLRSILNDEEHADWHVPS